MKEKFEILNHGAYCADYFPGCGTAYSDFDHVATGAGSNAKEAYEDAVEQIYQHLGDEADKLKLPKNPNGIRKTDRVESSSPDAFWYVSIRY